MFQKIRDYATQHLFRITARLLAAGDMRGRRPSQTERLRLYAILAAFSGRSGFLFLLHYPRHEDEARKPRPGLFLD